MQLKRYVYYFLIIISFIYLLNVSWLRWGNLIIDTFRDPWIAYKISQGKVLYKDLHYFFGPLPNYLLAFLFKIVGIHLNSIIFTGIIIACISTIFIYRISRLFLERIFSTLIVLNFLFVFAFGCYSYTGIFNFILPYNLVSTFFIMFVLSSLYFFIKFIKKEKLPYLIYCGISIYFMFLSRMDFSIIIWVVLTFIYYFSFYSNVSFNKDNHKKLGIILYPFLPLLAGLLSYAIFLYVTNGFNGFYESVLDTFALKGRGKWESHISGFNASITNSVTVLKSFIFQSIAVFLLYIVIVLLCTFFRKVKKGIADKITLIIIGLIAGNLVLCLFKFMDSFHQYRLIPLLLILGIALLTFRFFFIKDVDKKNNLSLITLFIVSLALIFRIVLTLSPNFYGFYLLPPALIAYYIMFVKMYPNLIKKIIKTDHHVKKYYYVALTIFLALLAFPFAKTNYTNYRHKNCLVVTDRGRIKSFSDVHTKRFWEAVVYLTKNTPENSTVVAFPEGIGLNFFSHRDNPLRYFTYIPNLVLKIGENTIIEELEKHRIDYIVILQRSTAEHGYPVFGEHYGSKIRSWIFNNYTLEKLIGPYPFTTSEFGLAIYIRNER